MSLSETTPQPTATKSRGRCPSPAPGSHDSPVAGLTDTALRIRAKSVEKWGERKAVNLIGESSQMELLLRKLEKFARFNEPILITGESGVGKELVARACYLLSSRTDRPFTAVNCPQYQEGNLTVSELFGHTKGSFTGATADRKGLFETGDGGMIFLDEIADLHMSAQVMLLRALAEGEYKPVGSSATRSVNVRVVAATNRPLKQLMVAKEFRNDLYFRLSYFRLEIPPLRSRGDDWLHMLNHFLQQLNAEYGVKKSFSSDALKLLASYKWPGNVRELKSIVTMGFSLSETDTIETRDFVTELEEEAGKQPAQSELYLRMVENKESFWDAVYTPFMERDLNRFQVKAIIQKGLIAENGSYRRMMALFNLPESQYHKFMDFLRHHGLKSDQSSTEP